MPMDATVLATAIRPVLKNALLDEQDAAMAALGFTGDLAPTRPDLRVALADAMAKAIADVVADKVVAHIIANARVTVSPVVAFPIPVTVVPATGVGATTATGTSNDTAGTIV